MLLVLAVLAVALAVLYPATEQLYRTHRFRQAAQQVQAALAATRVRAIDQGVIYRFYYEPDGRRFLAIPHGRRQWTASEDEGDVANPKDRPSGWRCLGELPRGMRFGAGEAGGERISRQQLGELPDAGQLAVTIWSRPILFYPDGSADDAEIRFTGGDDQSIRLAVRGLTGAASVISGRPRTAKGK
jgi:type II secretory pathway pseudopilin PulG